jgi:hypothetical protein
MLPLVVPAVVILRQMGAQRRQGILPAFEKRYHRLLSLDVDAFIARLRDGITPKPADMTSISRFNQGRASG